MKKGLLSFLLAALTLVGCQNYDDQFDELNAKILALQSELTSISAIQSAITDLNTKIAAVQSSALTAADLAGIISDLDAVQAAVENLGSVGTEVENLNAEVDEILAALDDLLAANAVINQDLRITSDAELRYVASLVNLEPTPTVIVNGYVEVDPSFAATNTAKLDSILAITNKINTILGNSVNVGLTTAGTSLTFNELSFLDANMSISGGVVALPKLVTVGGDITLNYSGNYSFPLISRAATITLTDNSGLVAVDFSGLTTANSIQSTAGKLSLTKATSVKLGSISLPASVTLPETTEFVTLKTGAQGASIRRGLELYGSKETDSYKAVFSYSFSDFIFDSYVVDGLAYDGNRLPAIPKHHAFLSFKYKFTPTIGGEIKAKHVGAFFADDKNNNEVDGYSIFQFRLWKDFKNYNLYVGANNLFNKKYFDNIRINAFANRFYEPAPMRNYYAGINFKI